MMSYDKTLEQTIHESGVLRCLECGKCTAICPIARYDGGFSPRVTVGRALVRHDEALLRDDRLWTCINCLQCNQVCPAAVDYSSLTTAVRIEARRLGQAALCTHGETIHVWMRMMTRPDLRQNRLEWLSPNLKYETLAPALRSGPFGSAGVRNRPNPLDWAESTMIEPLSERELDVLRLLRTELTGPEIARQLSVSLNTLRTHTKNIYSKLGVSSRRAALRRAEELGLL